jgi:hypothetical protein
MPSKSNFDRLTLLSIWRIPAVLCEFLVINNSTSAFKEDRLSLTVYLLLPSAGFLQQGLQGRSGVHGVFNPLKVGL